MESCSGMDELVPGELDVVSAVGGADPADRPFVAVALKCVQLRHEVDPLTGMIERDNRLSGMSRADAAALELGLRHAAAIGADLLAVTVGAETSESMLRDAAACGADRVVRIDPGVDQPDPMYQPTSATVARLLAPVLSGAASVWCGDWSLDRGSGTVPAMVAHLLGIDHALGLVSVDVTSQAITAWRRLDGGRREQVLIDGPAVLSVEGAAAALRRADIGRTITSRTMPVHVLAAIVSPSSELVIDRVAPHRPPPRVALGDEPAGVDPQTRVETVLGVGVVRAQTVRLKLDADDAADLILERLAQWGVYSNGR
jgi:electron transfer flavoprotein beta subunit